MKKRGHQRIVTIGITLVITLAVLHTASHFALYGTGVQGIVEEGISGFAINETEGSKKISAFSKYVIIGEWALLVILIMISMAGDKVRTKKQHVAIQLKKSTDTSKTDIDLLYDILKEKKGVSIGTIAETFKLTEKTATEWAKILEDADLATIHYPRFGEPEVRIK